MSTKLTMSAATIRERVEENADGLTAVDLRAIEMFLDRQAYRNEYNKRPEVRARRREYNEKRRDEMKRGKELLEQILAVRKEIEGLKKS